MSELRHCRNGLRFATDAHLRRLAVTGYFVAAFLLHEFGVYGRPHSHESIAFSIDAFGVIEISSS